MRFHQMPGNCGMAVLVLQNPFAEWYYGGDIQTTEKRVLRHIFENIKHPGLVVFSDNIRHKDGETLAALLRKHKLGKITASITASNPNHNNITTIRTWVWAPEYRRLAELGRKHGWRNRVWGRNYERLGQRRELW